jgi:hypothetical protein
VDEQLMANGFGYAGSDYAIDLVHGRGIDLPIGYFADCTELVWSARTP